MPRTFDPASLVAVPQLSAAGAITLGTELKTAAVGQASPSSVKASFEVVCVSLDQLREALGDQLPTPIADGGEARRTDTILDACYSGMYDWLRGWRKIPEELVPDVAALAEQMAETLFPEGLKFTQLPFKLQWAESQRRLDAVDKLQLAPNFEKLGGLHFLQATRAAHQQYGKALGITASKTEPAPTPEVRGALGTFTEALRSYVVQVVAHADADKVKGPALAKILLKPLETWESPSGSRPANGEGDAPTPVGGVPV